MQATYIVRPAKLIPFLHFHLWYSSNSWRLPTRIDKSTCLQQWVFTKWLLWWNTFQVTPSFTVDSYAFQIVGYYDDLEVV